MNELYNLEKLISALVVANVLWKLKIPNFNCLGVGDFKEVWRKIHTDLFSHYQPYLHISPGYTRLFPNLFQ